MSWFEKDQAQKRSEGQRHLDLMQSHMSAANSSVNADDHDAAAYHMKAAALHGQAGAGWFDKHSKHWIQKAIKHPGALTKQAKAAGKGVQAFASSVRANPDKHSATTVKRANLAKTLGAMHK